MALGLEDAEIDEARVQAAVRMAQLDELVASLPHELNTCVGEQGDRLSGGERQRIATARALYGNHPSLIFDEATSALELPTERALSAAISESHGAKTIVIIAHRMSTVAAWDRLVYLKAGRICYIGPYEELRRRNSEFRALAGVEDAEP